jgi:hypothetical protein
MKRKSAGADPTPSWGPIAKLARFVEESLRATTRRDAAAYAAVEWADPRRRRVRFSVGSWPSEWEHDRKIGGFGRRICRGGEREITRVLLSLNYTPKKSSPPHTHTNYCSFSPPFAI